MKSHIKVSWLIKKQTLPLWLHSNLFPGNQTPGGSTPSGFTPGGSTPSGFTPGGITPSGTTPTGAKAMAMATPTPGHLMSMTPEQLQAYTWQREIDERNRPLSDDELDSLFPPGYKVSFLVAFFLAIMYWCKVKGLLMDWLRKTHVHVQEFEWCK